MTDPFEHRRAATLHGLAPDGRGIELGPLDNPIARRPDYDVLYVDHADTVTIRAKYAAHATVGEIVDVDVAWDGRLRDLVPSDVPIRWAIASHVIEHVPDLSSWLDEIAEVVEVGGILSLVVPDHRYCFDANRAPSRPSDVLGAVLEGRSSPSAAQLVDYLCLTTGVDTAAIWRGESDHADRPANWQGGYELAVAAFHSPDYVDCHCWTFTPSTFLDVLEALFAVGKLRTWTVERIDDTPPGFLEFYVKLRRVDPEDTSDADRRGSVDLARSSLPAPQAGDAPIGEPEPTLSPLESRLIASKRRAAALARRVPPVSLLLRRRDERVAGSVR